MLACFLMAAMLLVYDICYVWDIDWDSTRYSDPYWASVGEPQTLRFIVSFWTILVGGMGIVITIMCST